MRPFGSSVARGLSSLPEVMSGLKTPGSVMAALYRPPFLSMTPRKRRGSLGITRDHCRRQNDKLIERQTTSEACSARGSRFLWDWQVQGEDPRDTGTRGQREEGDENPVGAP